MGRKVYPRFIGEMQAEYLYPALPEIVRSSMGVKGFANKIEEILIKNRDLVNKQEATAKGEAHGLKNSMASGWEYDDDGNETMHCTLSYVYASDEGSEYIKELIKSYYPGFDENAYLKHKAELELHHRLCSILLDEDFRKLPKKVIDILKGIVSKNYSDKYIYICCDYEDEKYIFGVLKNFQWAYKESSFLKVMSAEQFSVNLKYDTLRGDEYKLKHYLNNTGKEQDYFFIDRIEDITKDLNAQKHLEEAITCRKDVQVIILSEREPKWIFGLSEGMKKILNSATYIDFRQWCRDFKNGNTTDNPDDDS